MATYTNKSKSSTVIVNKLGVHDGWQYNEPEVQYNQEIVTYNLYGPDTAWTNKARTAPLDSFELLIGDGYKLTIDENFDLLIQGGTDFERATPASSTYTNKAKSGATIQYNLLIGDGYELDIGGGFNLVIAEASTGVTWTNKTRNN